MAWKKSTTTKHTCPTNWSGAPFFGRKTPGCPRCDELLAGAKPVEWKHFESRAERDRRECKDLDEHFKSEKHRKGLCNGGLPCTYGQW